MKKLLLITGDIATGKSTFAQILSKRYNVNLFFKDSIKEVLSDTIGFSDRNENKKLSVASVNLMFFIFSEFAKLNKNLILEANFHSNELNSLCKLADENGYDVLTIALYGNAEILHKRYVNRKNNQNRHPVHLSTSIEDFDEFKKCSDYIQSIELPAKTIKINADSFSYQDNQELLHIIDEFMNI